RAQPFVHQLGELARERRLLDFVFADQEIDGIGGARGDLLADGGNRRRQNASRMELTIVRANSLLMRSSALASC
ncbi:MAG TPA: hypothetical protein VFA27_09965, partial [Vicinamibacterales bacterium]|nr:hypothetical protein [Vicinamibacterales bacterium]